MNSVELYYVESPPLHELRQTTCWIAPLHELRQTTCPITPSNTRAIRTLSTIPLTMNSIKTTCPIASSHKLHELRQTILCPIAPLTRTPSNYMSNRLLTHTPIKQSQSLHDPLIHKLNYVRVVFDRPLTHTTEIQSPLQYTNSVPHHYTQTFVRIKPYHTDHESWLQHVIKEVILKHTSCQ